MRRRILFLVLALLMTVPSISFADMVCEEGHSFFYNGRWYCNPGSGPQSCLRCWDTITVGGCDNGCTPEEQQP